MFTELSLLEWQFKRTQIIKVLYEFNMSKVFEEMKATVRDN